MFQSRFKQPSWKYIYPLVDAAVINLESVDSLLRQAVATIATHGHADCLLWSGLDPTTSDAAQVYGPATVLQRLGVDVREDVDSALLIVSESETSDISIQSYTPAVLPDWLLQQQQSPQITQNANGDLIIPACSGDRLRLILQLQLPTSAASYTAEASQPTTNLPAWSDAEVEALDIVASQLVLAINTLYWRRRLEESRQQAALVGRIVRLLNSSLNPNEIVECIVAELGQGLNSDRCILVDLRDDPVHILASWDHPEHHLHPLAQRHIDRALWQDTIDMFLQGAASYLELEVNQLDADPLLEWLKAIKALAALIVPLFVHDEFFGAVLLLSYEQERIYELDELQTIRQVADQAAVALTNAQHYQSLWYKQETLRLQNNSLQLEVIHDELTQLLNRRSLERELSQISAPAQWSLQPPFSIIVCDLDYFKLINDSYGHLVGDEVLYSLAQRFQKQLRMGTSAYRYGGEEFIVLLLDVTADKAFEVAERLRLAIRSTPFETTIGPLAVTASFGVAQQNPVDDQDAWDTVQRADKALYEAKRQGRDRVVTF
jgi:diguanylate cyclase (GGDEF)-like protein